MYSKDGDAEVVVNVEVLVKDNIISTISDIARLGLRLGLGATVNNTHYVGLENNQYYQDEETGIPIQ